MTRDPVAEPMPGDVWAYLYRPRLIRIESVTPESIGSRWCRALAPTIAGVTLGASVDIEDRSWFEMNDYRLVAVDMSGEAFDSLTRAEALALWDADEVTP